MSGHWPYSHAARHRLITSRVNFFNMPAKDNNYTNKVPATACTGQVTLAGLLSGKAGLTTCYIVGGGGMGGLGGSISPGGSGSSIVTTAAAIVRAPEKSFEGGGEV